MAETKMAALLVSWEDLEVWNWDELPAKAKKRDKKRHKKKHGMRTDGAGLKLLARLIPKKKTHRG